MICVDIKAKDMLDYYLLSSTFWHKEYIKYIKLAEGGLHLKYLHVITSITRQTRHALWAGNARKGLYLLYMPITTCILYFPEYYFWFIWIYLKAIRETTHNSLFWASCVISLHLFMPTIFLQNSSKSPMRLKLFFVLHNIVLLWPNLCNKSQEGEASYLNFFNP